MAKLILSMDGLVLKEIPLLKERTTIGRKPHNDVQIDNLAISGEHAVIVTILNDSFLEDLNSTNGTYVNGQPVKKHFLQHSDVVELGKYRLKYISDAHVGNGSDDFQKTVLLRPEHMRRPQERAPAARGDTVAAHAAPPAQAREGGAGGAGTGRERSAADEGGASKPATTPGVEPVGVVQLLNGANAGRELLLTKSLTTLGKPGVQVAVITRRSNGYYLSHVEGANRPSVNGIVVEGQPHPLRDRDVIELAGVRMEFVLRPMPVASAQANAAGVN
ncbi:MAG: FHA domain-containing protein [Betaproteobacteria bacterium]|nr:FHA domain-containing protein [Betaproteobacteria bacterium]